MHKEAQETSKIYFPSVFMMTAHAETRWFPMSWHKDDYIYEYA